MKKRIGKKLTLHRETVRHLSPEEALQAHGGFITDRPWVCTDTQFSCPSVEPSFCNEPVCP